MESVVIITTCNNYDYFIYYLDMLSKRTKLSIDTKYIEGFLKFKKDTNNNYEILFQYFNIIKRYFEYIYANDSSNNNKYCRYINYWIKTHFKEDPIIDTDPMIAYSDDYAKNYISILNKKMKNNCKIENIDEDIYIIIGNLYKICDNYTGILYYIRNNAQEYKIINNIKSLIEEYNKLITPIQYSKDNDFLN
ncbi:Plasmodium exported protein, unknown function [Plasmodium gonderi]|uniref:Variable surface protein n=1 Tax=Plasmodium gonderi TaxID=77519 RepID=A0A1Y1JTY1_PLAGO|nr:Plasmodium exported protein, unknown function [Plasmodium gonderi]GAW84567.1 Plasmodium exported protein, unknown function [Plasmodium gonderi]